MNSSPEDAALDPATHCLCPPSHPDWDDCDIDLTGHCIHRVSTPAFFFMPLSYELSLAKQTDNIRDLDVEEIWPGFALTQTRFFKGTITRLLKDTQSPSRHIQFLPTPFVVQVNLHKGGIGSIKKVVHQQQIDLVEKGRKPKELFLVHLTCPVCEAEKGGEKILMIRRWLSSKGLQAGLAKSQRKAP